jgi:spermidine synthase
MTIRITEDEGVRYLEFSAHWIQGAMRIRRPWALELEYTRDMMFPLLLRQGAWPRRVLQVGLGAGSLAKFFLRHLPRVRVEVVEIEPEVITAAWQFFHLPPESARFAIEIGDGFRHIASTRSRYDLILCDGFDAKAAAGKLDSAAFYRRCRERLAPGGMLVTNLISRRGRPKESIARIGAAFAGRVLTLPPNEANTIAIGVTGPRLEVAATDLHVRARRLRARTGLDLTKTLKAQLGRPSAERLEV